MAKKIITLDPGHGKDGNKSPNNPAYVEGTQMWHFANKLKVSLEQYGFEVVTTRPNITDKPELSDRGGTAGKNGSCIFLSLHSNSPGKSSDGTYNASITGVTVYYSMTRAENKEISDKLGKRISEVMGNYFRGSKIKQYPDKEGVDYYGVLRSAAQTGCKCALLVEHGFHTNLKDSNFLLDDNNLQILADAEAEVIADYFGMKKVVPAEAKLYRVQVGAFTNKSLAEKTLAKVKSAGFEDAYIMSTNVAVSEPLPVAKSIDQLAQEVIEGKWGNGSERKKRLTEAGYDYEKVQKRVNELCK